MDSIRIKNLRSLVDTGDLEIKPLNIILGTNSSGKSSYLRFYPLLRQTISRKIRGVLFWSGYGDDDVDFGSFDTALNNQAGHNKMEFSFSFKVTKEQARKFYRFLFFSQRYLFENEVKIMVNICLEKVNEKGQESISKINLNIFGVYIQLDIQNEKIILNERAYKLKESRRKYINNLDSIFQLDLLFNFSDTFKEEMQKIIKEIDSKDVELRSEYSDIINKDFKNVYIEKSNNLNIQERNDLSEKELIIYKDMLLVDNLDMILRIVDSYLTSYFKNSVYVAPLRATAERYYRLRNLSIEEVDSSGRNLTEFLYNIDNKKFENFQIWTNKYLGFKVEKDVESEFGQEGYVSIYITRQGQKKRYNLSDTGFGYSQILPIVTQLWFIKSSKGSWNRDGVPKTIIIEQPELHLHPALQCKLISAISSLSSDDYRFIIETHSETIINKVGNLIGEGELNNNDVNLQLFFKADDNESETIVKSSQYDKDGYLKNWPIGFFDDGDSF